MTKIVHVKWLKKNQTNCNFAHAQKQRVYEQESRQLSFSSWGKRAADISFQANLIWYFPRPDITAAKYNPAYNSKCLPES